MDDEFPYEEYSAWLLETAQRRDYRICNGDDLIRALERGDGFDDFLSEKGK